MVKYTFVISILFLSGFFAAAASACAMLTHGDPKVGSIVSGPVDHVSLAFSGKIYPGKSSLIVTDEGGRQMSTGKLWGSDTTLSIKVIPLPPGLYKVRWKTYCDCKSYMPGSYKFTVQ